MANRLFAKLGLLLVGLLVVTTGCKDKGKEISFTYDKPPVYDISKKIRRVAVVEFGIKKDTKQCWGQIASDKLASELDKCNRSFNRYELVDRKRVSAIMDERDFQMSVADTDSAVKFGKIAKVDAMIYGTVYVNENVAVEKIPLPTYKGIGISHYEKKYYRSTAAVTFTMDDVQTGKTICTVTVNRKYDSKDKKDKDKYSVYGKNLGAITQKLIDECVQEFISKVSPHKEHVSVCLQKGNSQAVRNGNKFAFAREYTDAMEMYQAGLEQDPKDHGAMFNMGVCYEAMGQLDKAYVWYNKAVKLNPEMDYIHARRRVRVENK